MARNIAPEDYVFNPTTKTITIERYIKKIHIFLIVNATTNQVLFNFSDPATTAAVSYLYPENSISNPFGQPDYKTVIQLNASLSTTGMSSTDSLQIVVDDELSES